MIDKLYGGIINIYIYMCLWIYMVYCNKLLFFKIYFRNLMLVYGLEYKKNLKNNNNVLFII